MRELLKTLGECHGVHKQDLVGNVALSALPVRAGRAGGDVVSYDCLSEAVACYLVVPGRIVGGGDGGRLRTLAL